MKEITKKLLLVLMAVILSVTSYSCSDDNKEDEPQEDYASAISGVYTGQLTSGGYVIEDVYVVTITKISNKAVRVNAELFENGGANFNVTYKNGMYTLESNNIGQMTASVQQKTLSMSFLNGAGSMTTFYGSKD